MASCFISWLFYWLLFGMQTPQRVVCLGDSLTAGYGVDPAHAFPAVVQTLAAEEGVALELVNAGVSGDTTAGGLRRINWLAKGRIDVLILALGANDGLRGLPPEEIKANLKKIIQSVRQSKPEALILLAGMKVPPNLGPTYSQAFEQVFVDLAAEEKVDSLPFLLEGVAGHPALNQADGIHPTIEGHRIVGQLVWSKLRPMVKK
jgi:acyl-CoA thioesterase-1